MVETPAVDHPEQDVLAWDPQDFQPTPAPSDALVGRQILQETIRRASGDAKGALDGGDGVAIDWVRRRS
jgi:hypothetical protein